MVLEKVSLGEGIVLGTTNFRTIFFLFINDLFGFITMIKFSSTET